MVSARKVLPPSLPASVLGEVARFPDQPKVQSATDEASSRMGDEGCPNESQSMKDATESSKEEEEVSAMSCKEIL
jgi:hypothetical protein